MVMKTSLVIVSQNFCLGIFCSITLALEEDDDLLKNCFFLKKFFLSLEYLIIRAVESSFIVSL